MAAILNLTLQQKQIASVRKYTGEYYQNFNRDLRDNSIPTNTESLTDYVNIWNFLNNNRITANIIVYRGVRINPAIQEESDRFQRSLHSRNTHFISTSLDRDIAQGFLAGYDCCLMRILLPAGSLACDIRPYSIFGGEEEILLAPGFIEQLDDDNSITAGRQYECSYQNYRDNEVIYDIYRRTIEPENCIECGINPAVIYCHTCRQNYCLQDYAPVHVEKYAGQNHINYAKVEVLRNTSDDILMNFRAKSSKTRKSKKTTRK